MFLQILYNFSRIFKFMIFIILVNITNIYSQAISFSNELNSSNLPIVIINTNGQHILDSPKITAEMGIIYNGENVRNNISDSLNNFHGNIGIEIRGATSQSFPKKQYGFETRDSLENNLNVSLLGMPEENDWILSAPYSDKSLIRNVLEYRLASDIGRYASRTKLCELVLNGQYQGVYILMEKIKRDKGRVNISKLDPEEISGDDVTGGYILKIDKFIGDDLGGWRSAFPVDDESGKLFFQYHYPNPTEIVSEQEEYIENYMYKFEEILSSDDFSDSVNGYAKYIDVDSFIDYFLLTELSKNIDGYRLSTFLYKDRGSKGGKLTMGPMWDYNLAFGNADYFNGFETSGWWKDSYYGGMNDIPFWWDRLFQDKNFTNRVEERWESLRQNEFSSNRIFSLIDSLTTELNESQVRNFKRWPVLGYYVWPNYFIGNSYNEEITYLKEWITDRLNWMDENIKIQIDNEIIDDQGEFALQFNGTGNFVNCGNHESISISGNELTLEAWIKADKWKQYSHQGVIIANDNMGWNEDFGYALRCGDNGQIDFVVGDGKWHELHSNAGVLSLNQWNHIAATYNGNKMKIYVNGKLKISKTDKFEISKSPKNLFIGSSPSDFSRCFSGEIDDVRIWNVCRTEDELNSAMNVGIEKSAHGLAGYWRFNEGSTQTTKDKIGNNNGTLGTVKADDDADPIWVSANDLPVSIEISDNSIPNDFVLKQNYPNPFNPVTTIEYSIHVGTSSGLSLPTTKLTIYDVLGNEIKTLVNKEQSAGNYKVKFDASHFASGTYFYQMRSGSFIQTKKLILIK
ncbi:MAG: CotH kinase family protein [Melioribacteraceae bacterium]|nr:CotH kinase family protein [Melioribacteraceae bacterium]